MSTTRIAVSGIIAACMALSQSATVRAAAVPSTLPGQDMKTVSAPPPGSVAEAMQAAVSLFDAAKSENWDAAAKQLDALKSNIKKLKTEVFKPSAEQKKRITQLTTDLGIAGKAVAAKAHQQTMMAANRISRVSGLLAGTYSTSVPAPLRQMQYLSRELEVWSVTPADMVKLKALYARLDAEWQKISGEVATRAGADAVSQYSAAAKSVQSAKTTDDYAHSAKPLQDALATLKSSFGK